MTDADWNSKIDPLFSELCYIVLDFHINLSQKLSKCKWASEFWEAEKSADTNNGSWIIPSFIMDLF